MPEIENEGKPAGAEQEPNGDNTEGVTPDAGEQTDPPAPTAADIENLKAALKKERQARADAEKRAKEHEAPKPETDVIEQARQEAEKAATERLNKRVLRSELKAAAKGVLQNVKDAEVFIDLDQFQVDDNGDVDPDAISDAIKKLLEERPYLAANAGTTVVPDIGQGNRGHKLTEAERLQEQLAEATSKGRHVDAIALKQRIAALNKTK